MAVNITITDTAYRGSGVGRSPEGKAVFVPYTVTGDEVTVEITEDKGSYSVGVLKDIVTPSPWRTVPHCEHHGICGGCHFGHIKYENQLEIKKNIILQELRKHPQYHEIKTILEVVSANPIDYRIRATVRSYEGMAGFFKGLSNNFVPIRSCPVIKTSLYTKCLQWASSADKGMQTLAVIETPSGEAIALAEGCKNLTSKNFDGVSDGKKYSGKGHLMYDTIAGAVPVGYGGFFQANRFLSDRFQTQGTAGATGRVLELYAGSGFFTVALMKNATVKAIELNKTAATLAQSVGLPVTAADVAVIAESRAKYDLIFMDPPRDGVDKRTLAAVTALAPVEITYVSCNPTTLARDLCKLTDYKIIDITLFDMFPHTFHIETIVKLQRTN